MCVSEGREVVLCTGFRRHRFVRRAAIELPLTAQLAACRLGRVEGRVQALREFTAPSVRERMGTSARC